MKEAEKVLKAAINWEMWVIIYLLETEINYLHKKNSIKIF